MKHPWSARCLLALLALPLASACDSSTNNPPTTEDKAAPTTRATPAGGQYSANVTVSLLCDDAGGSGCAATHYTLDGSEPTTASPTFRDAIALTASTSLKFFSVDKAGNSEAVHTEQYTFGTNTGPDTTPPTTVASPAGGALNAGRQVTLTCSDGAGSGCAATHYTLDGSEPTAQSPRYSAPLVITGPTTLRFFSVDKADNAEAVRTESYTFDSTPPTVAASLPGGTYGTARMVALTCEDGSGSGCAAILYTTDGTTPTAASAVYTAPLNVAATTTLRFFARDNAGNTSPVSTERYVIDTTGPATAASPGSGVFNFTLNVTLTCDDAGGTGCEATYFTTDGTAPTTASRRYTAPVAVTSTTTLRFFSVDKAGNEGARGTETYTLDFFAPTTTASPPGGNYRADTQVTLACADTGGSGCDAIFYSTDPALPTSSYTRYTQPVTLSANTTLKYFSVDRANNREDVRTQVYTVDLAAPVTVASPRGGSYNQTQQVSFSCSDGVGTGCAATHYTTDGSTPTRSSRSLAAGQTLPISTNTVLKFFSVDAAENQEAVKTETYLIDTQPPATTATPGPGVYGGTQSVRLACADGAGSGCKATWYTVDGTTPTRASPQYDDAQPLSITASTVLRFFSVDHTDNAEPVQVASYTIDTVAPTVVANPKGGAVQSTVSVTLTCSDAGGSECDYIVYTLDGSEPRLDSSPRYSAPLSISTTRTLRFLARDRVGNPSAPGSETYSFDTTPPTVAATPAGRTSNSALSVTLTCDDGGVPCKAIHYTVDGSTPDVATSSRYTGPLTVSTTTTLKFLGQDEAGNTSAVRTESYVIDTARPVTSANPPGGNVATSTVTVTLTCADTGGSGCDAIYYTLDGSTPSTSSQVYSGAFTFGSTTTLRFFATDKAGNAEAVQTHTYTLPHNAAETSAQIAALRGALDGPVSQPIDKALVTYVKPGAGNLLNDPAGFFLQAEQQGPALFVVDPGNLTPAPQPGDRVSLVASSKTTSNGQPRVTGFTSYVRHNAGESVSVLRQDVSNVDLPTQLESYDTELITLAGTITNTFISAGSGHVQAALNTVGVPMDSPTASLLRLRMVATVQDELDLGNGCSIQLTSPLWRFNTTAQPSAWATRDVQVLGCPGPRVTSALALSPNTLSLRFDRRIAPSSVLANGSQFTFDNGLTATGATVMDREVRLTTSGQVAGRVYTVTAASSVKDTYGTAVDAGANSTTFTGYQQPARLLINEVAPNIGSGRDLVELYVAEGGNTANMTLVQDGSATPLATLPAASVATGDFIVVHLNPDKVFGPVLDAPGSETTSKSQYSQFSYSSNYDTAWDFHGGTAGITLGNVVLRVKDPAGTTQDAVPFVRINNTVAVFLSQLQTLQAEGLWFPSSCGGVPCAYTETSPTAYAVSVDWTGLPTSTTRFGNATMYRQFESDSDQVFDWVQGIGNTLGGPNNPNN